MRHKWSPVCAFLLLLMSKKRKRTERENAEMLLHLCRCGRPIPQGIALCETCAATAASRHMIYNRQDRSKRSADFYVSRAWRIMRARMIEVFDGWDVVALVVDGKLLKAEEVHHIVELEDDWEKRLDPWNLIPLNADTHKRITAAYKRSKPSMEACQKQLRECRTRYFEEAGGVEKVFKAAGLVAPLSIVEKNPHWNF